MLYFLIALYVVLGISTGIVVTLDTLDNPTPPDIKSIVLIWVLSAVIWWVYWLVALIRKILY